MPGPPSRRKKLIRIIIILGRFALDDAGTLYDTGLNLSSALLPGVDEIDSSFAGNDTASQVDYLSNLIGTDVDNPGEFTEQQLQDYVNALASYIQL